MDKSRVEPTLFFIEKISFSLKLFSGHFYGQSFIKTVRSPFGIRHREEQISEIILNLDQWVRRRCRLKIFLIWSSGSHFVQWSKNICAILVKGIMRNNSVKLF